VALGSSIMVEILSFYSSLGGTDIKFSVLGASNSSAASFCFDFAL